MQMAVILLAAGASQRMGASNKLLLRFGGQTLLGATLSQLEAADVGEILVVVGHEAALVSEALQGRRCQIVENPHYRQGLTSSIQAGIAQAAPAAGYMICLADMPLIPAAVYRLLAGALACALVTDPACIVQPVFEGRRGHPVLFSAAYRQALLDLDTPDGARPVVQAHVQHLLTVQVSTDAVLLDADTPEGYAALVERAAANYKT